MNPLPREERERLLARYATGGLTPEERARLLEASLDDAELFSVLAEEEPLRDLLEDPGVRAEVSRALEPRPKPWFARPWTWAAAAPALAGLLVAGFFLMRPGSSVQAPVDMARLESAKTPAPHSGVAPMVMEPRRETPAAPILQAPAQTRAAKPVSSPAGASSGNTALPAAMEAPPELPVQRAEVAELAKRQADAPAIAAAPPPVPLAENREQKSRIAAPAAPVELRKAEADAVSAARAGPPAARRTSAVAGAVADAPPALAFRERESGSRLVALPEVELQGFRAGEWISLNTPFEVPAGTPVRFLFRQPASLEAFRLLPDGTRVVIPPAGWTPTAPGKVDFVLEPAKITIQLRVR